MKEIFESTVDNVSDIEVKGYSDPVNMERTMEIWAKTGEEEYIYKFTGPGVDKFEAAADGRCWKENKKLREAYDKLWEENKQLKKENEKLRDRFSNQIQEYIETNDRLRREKEEREVSAVAAKEKNKLLEIENEKLKKELHSLKQERTNIPKTHSSRSDILDQAKKCVCGQREQDYGTPESNFQLIADLWNGYLGNNLSKEKRDFEKELGITHDHKELSVPWEISATDVAMMMALMKIARIRNGGGSGDSFVDLAGYAACGGEIWHGERHSST